MKWIITTYAGVSDGEESVGTFECPFRYFQTVYYVYPQHRFLRKDRWVISRNRVTEVWATNTFGVRLDDGNHIHESLFDRLFTDKEAAIEFA